MDRKALTSLAACALLVVGTASCASTGAPPEQSMPARQGQVAASQSTQPTATPVPLSSAESVDWIPSDLGQKFQRKAQQLKAQADLGLVDMAGGTPFSSIGGAPTFAYSTIKLGIVATFLRLNPDPTQADEQRIRLAITQSDNKAAAELYNHIKDKTGSERKATQAIEATLAKGGDRSTRVLVEEDIPNWKDRQEAGVQSAYGQSLWSVGNQAVFVASLLRGCVLDDKDTDYLSGLMTGISPSQDWGLGEVAGVEAFKGGWGVDAGIGGKQASGWYVRQVGQFDPARGGPYVMAIAVHLDSPTGMSQQVSDTAEARTIETLGDWVVKQLGEAPPEVPC